MLCHVCQILAWLIEIIEGLRASRPQVTISWGGGGGLNLTQFCPYFSAFLKKKQGHFLTQKEYKFQPILNNLENCYEIVTWGQLARSYSILDVSMFGYL